MSDRFDEVFQALEKQAGNLASRLEGARARIHQLEEANQTLEARLSDIQKALGNRPDTPANSVTTPSTTSTGQSVSDSANNLDSHRAQSETAASQTGQAVEEKNADVREKALTDREVQQPSSAQANDSEPAVEHSAVHEQQKSASNASVPETQQQEDISPQALLRQWYKRYPKTFFERHTRPLAIGIHETLAEREPYSAKLIRRALAGYVNLPRYLKSVRANTPRIDLEGNESGRVGEEDALHAREQLKQLQERQQEREAEKNKRRMAQKMSQLAQRHHQ